MLRDEWREPLRAQRDPISEDSGRPRSNRESRRRWRKQTCSADSSRRTAGVPMRCLRSSRSRSGWCIRPSTEPAFPDTEEAQGPAQGPPTIGASSTSIVGAPPKGLTQFDANLPTGILPDGGPYTEAGAKTWHVVPGADPKVGQGTAKSSPTPSRSRTASTPPPSAATTVSRGWSADLSNPKSWTHNPQFAFTRVDSGEPDFRVSLTTPDTAREGCGYEIPHRDVLRTRPTPDGRPGSSSTWPAGCAVPCRSRAIWAPTDST